MSGGSNLPEMLKVMEAVQALITEERQRKAWIAEPTPADRARFDNQPSEVQSWLLAETHAVWRKDKAGDNKLVLAHLLELLDAVEAAGLA